MKEERIDIENESVKKALNTFLKVALQGKETVRFDACTQTDDLNFELQKVEIEKRLILIGNLEEEYKS